MKLLITTLAMIFISFGDGAYSYEWTKYSTSKIVNLYYDDINVAKAKLTIKSKCETIFNSNCKFEWVQSISLNELKSYKETQTYKSDFRYRSLVNKKTYDCKTYKYYIHKRSYFKERVVYNDKIKPIRYFDRFSDQHINKYAIYGAPPKFKEGRLFEDIVKKLCKSFYPDGAKIFSQKFKDGKVLKPPIEVVQPPVK
jgi:hypothetical protein